MSGSVNKVILVGNLGRDPEPRTFPNGNEMVTLRIATTESWRDRNTGDRKERTEWHTVAIYNENLVNIAKNWLKKGSKIYVEGRLETRKWQDQSGQDRYSTEIAIRPFRGTFEMLSGSQSGSGNSQSNSGNRDQARGNAGGSTQSGGYQDGRAGGYQDDRDYSFGGTGSGQHDSRNRLDDEIPF